MIAPSAVRRLIVKAWLPTPRFRWRSAPGAATAAGTSKTLTQLARLCVAPHAKAGPQATSTLGRRELAGWIPELAARTDSQRAKLRGVKASRAHQILAGAVVADAIMDVLKLQSLDICPWALRERIFLDRLDALEGRPRFARTPRLSPV